MYSNMFYMYYVKYIFPILLKNKWPWLVWLSGWSIGLQTQGLPVQFPVRAHAWVAGDAPSRGHMRRNHTVKVLSFFVPPFPSLKINKSNLKKRYAKNNKWQISWYISNVSNMMTQYTYEVELR